MKRSLIEHLKSKKFSKETINAFRKTKREDFIPAGFQHVAYEDIPIPLSPTATVSQPYTIAFMLDLLELRKDKKQKIIEIGSGSGYVLALINKITNGKIFGVEINKDLVKKSKKKLRSSKNIKVFNKNGKNGLPKFAPYDRVLISAACKATPMHLVEQLRQNGIIVASVKDEIVKITKQNNKTKTQHFPGFVFVPLIE